MLLHASHRASLMCWWAAERLAPPYVPRPRSWPCVHVHLPRPLTRISMGPTSNLRVTCSGLAFCKESPGSRLGLFSRVDSGEEVLAAVRRTRLKNVAQFFLASPERAL